MEEFYLMRLSGIEGVGIKRIVSLLKHFKSPEAVWHADKGELMEVKGFSEKLADAVISQRNGDDIDRRIEELEKKGIGFISFLNPEYPRLLREIYNPPVGIYIRGTLPDDELNKVSVVGARRCSRYGARVAYDIARDLGKANVVVVSGMAKGIDSMAHRGIVENLGQTIAVLGCGVDVCYPAENRELMAQIIEHGCVISEYPPGTEPLAKHFPGRNRIISGLSKILLVVEAGKKSGTLITADMALDSGREVFVVPGNVTSALSEGTNDLIKQGCPIVTEGNDILAELGIAYKNEEKQAFSEKVANSLTQEEKEIYGLVRDKEPIPAEFICEKLNMSIQEAQYILSMLEIAGYIRKIPHAGYVREE